MNDPEDTRRVATLKAHGQLLGADARHVSDNEIQVDGDLPLQEGDDIQIDGKDRRVVDARVVANVVGKGSQTAIIHEPVE